MSTLVETSARPFRELVDRVSAEHPISDEDFAAIYAPRIRELGFTLAGASEMRRAAWAVVAQWLTAFASGAISADSSLSDAEEWFLGHTALPRVAPAISMAAAASGLSRDVAWALLPYIIDPFAPGTRRCVLRDQSVTADRVARKTAGVYYTPADLADYMVSSTFAGKGAAGNLLDPACGTGVFLRAAILRGHPWDRVFGCDISPLAAEQCAFVLLSAALALGVQADTPWALWQLGRARLATVDSLLLTNRGSVEFVERARKREVESAAARLADGHVDGGPGPDHPARALGALFPALARGAACVICNPPYAQFGTQAPLGEIGARFATFTEKTVSPKTNAYLPFVEQTWRLADPDIGCAVIVVPLSVAANTSAEFVALRTAMSKQPGAWTAAFFDRAPDALFGDDVKTRNAVLTYRADHPQAWATTGLMRWTSRSRQQLFRGIRAVPVESLDPSQYLPKLGAAWEVDLYHALRSTETCLGDDVSDVRVVGLPTEVNSPSVFVGPTAYNWISCALDVTPWAHTAHSAASRYRALFFEDDEAAAAAYCVFASRLALWLWRVQGDGFHVSRRFLLEVPMSVGRLTPAVRARLARLGRLAWSAAQQHAVVSVNKARTTVAFRLTAASPVLDDVDREVLIAAGADEPEIASRLREWHRRLVVVDESDDRRLGRFGRN